MIGTAIALMTLVSADGPQEAKIVAASLFKNGYAVVLRESSVNANGEAVIGGVKPVSLGTFWVVPAKGSTIESVTVTKIKKEKSYEIGSLGELLAANVGKDLVLSVTGNRQISGKLLSVNGEWLVIQDGERTVSFPKGTITEVSGAKDQVVWKRKGTEETPVLKIKTSDRSANKVYTFGLERGMSWVPAYAVDVSDPKKLSFTAKATIINDLSAINDLEVRLITGFPQLPYAGSPDPLSAGFDIAQFATLSTGGFGGGGGLGGQMAQNAMRADSFRDAGENMSAFNMSTAGGFQAEDLFFYKQPNVSLQVGDRGYFVMFKSEAPYDRVYKVDLADSISNGRNYTGLPDAPADVWTTLKFNNTAKQPLTTGTAIVLNDGNILGQTELKYSSMGAEVLLPFSKAMDVRVEDAEEETERQRANLVIDRVGTFDLVSLKGTIEVTNRKSQSVNMRITKSLTGEVGETTGDPKLMKTAKGIRRVNPQAQLRWEFTLEAGKSIKLNYKYRVFVD